MCYNLADQTYWQIFQFPILMNLQSVSKTTFQIVQREIVMPVLDHSWPVMEVPIFNKINDSNRCLWLDGDGKCDFPGFMQNIVLLFNRYWIEKHETVTLLISKLLNQEVKQKESLKDSWHICLKKALK